MPPKKTQPKKDVTKIQTTGTNKPEYWSAFAEKTHFRSWWKFKTESKNCICIVDKHFWVYPCLLQAFMDSAQNCGCKSGINR